MQTPQPSAPPGVQRTRRAFDGRRPHGAPRWIRSSAVVICTALALCALVPPEPAAAFNISSLLSSLFGSNAKPGSRPAVVVKSPYGNVSTPQNTGMGSGPFANNNSFQGGLPTLGGKFVGLRTEVPPPQITISCLPLPRRGITWTGTAGTLTIFMTWKYYRRGVLVSANSTQTASGIGPNTLDLLARPTPPPGAPSLLPHPYYDLLDLRIKVSMDNQGVLFESAC